MEANQQSSSAQENDSSKRRRPLESLTKDELVLKCKGLLGLAQKAKQAKDEYAEKNKILSEKLSECETQKEADKGSLLAMKEVIDSTTQNKLSLTSKITDLETQNEKLVHKITELENTISKQSEILIENEALKRQLKRLTDENEDLINDLEKMEAKFLQTSKEYAEQQNINEKHAQDATRKFEELEKKFGDIIDQNIEMKKFADSNKNQKNVLDINVETFDNDKIKNIETQNLEFSNQLKIMKNKEKNLLDEIQHLKNKINDVALKFKKLKGSRKVLMENEKDYSESVSKWQQDIKLVSQKLLAYIRALENDKRILEERIETIEHLTNNEETNYMSEIENKTKMLLKICDEAFNESERKLNEINELKLSVASKQDLNEDLIKEMNTLKSEISDLKRNKNSQADIQNSDEDENSTDDIKKILEEKNSLQKSLQDHILTYEELKLVHNQTSEILKSTKDSFENLKKDFKNLNKEVKINTETEKILKEEICDLIESSEQKNQAFKNTIKEHMQTIDRLKAENSELLNEMRELNEALKGRGDVISRQQNTISSLEAEVKKISSENKTKVESKENLVSNTRKLNESSSTTLLIPDNQSDVLSLCSISKAEDSTRMQDVNESLEEKYNKLKMLAIKMKRKLQEQKILISKLEKTETELVPTSESESNQNLDHNQIKKLQAEKDKFLKEIEDLNNKIGKQPNEINSLKDSLALLNENLKEKERLLEAEAKLRKSKEQIISEKCNELKLLKQEKDAFNLIRKELEKEKDSFKTKFSEKEKEITKLNDTLDKLRKDLEKSKAIGKQSSVLNLEIEAYEKSLNENAEKLNAIKLQNKELGESLQFKEDTISSLKQEIKLLEDNVHSEKTHSTELKQQIDIIQLKFKEVEHEKLELQSKLQDYMAESEFKHSQLEELRLQLSDISAKKDRQLSSITTEKDTICTQLVKTEEKLNQTESKLKVLELDLENVRTEYASYKIRAQSVLRQNQSKETSRERELEEELTTMHSNFETLNLKLSKSTEMIENQEKKIDELKQENERIQKRSKEIINILEESREQYDSLLEENRKQSKDYQESLKAHRLQIETLTNCYKEQISELEQKHSAAIEEIKKLNNTSTLVTRVGPFGASGAIEQVVLKSSDEQKVEMLLMEREDAEGSEASYTIPKRKVSAARSKHDVIPLDELLNSTLDENPEEIFSDENPKLSAENEILMLKEKLQSEEIKSKHLTSLLSETEQDLIKYTQLNEVLKEELRRQERTLEREKHMPNSEYLKNVILKFLTLNSGDEKSRLVPVLNTILRLSPDETNTLQNVAKGLETGRSWNLLPMWNNNNH